MHLDISSQKSVRIMSIVGVVCVLVAVLFVMRGTLLEPTPDGAYQERTNLGLPARLTIPKINLDASVIQVGLASDGTMDIPKGPDEVAWFGLGPRPGEKGAAVISGHYGWRDNIPAVFDDLHTLQKGDTLYVEDGKGGAVTFVVRELRIYDENDDATDVFASSDGKSHLNLVTCTGVWNKYKKSYSERLVVFADKE